MTMDTGSRPKDRILGDEWLDWKGADDPPQINEGKRTFLLLSLVVLVGFVLLAFLFWYLALPRFEQYGRPYAAILTVVVVAVAVFFLVWYALLIGAVMSQRIYLAICLHRRNNLFIMLFPAVARLAQSFGISRDRLSHSFIEVSNRLVAPLRQDGPERHASYGSRWHRGAQDHSRDHAARDRRGGVRARSRHGDS
jgi:hypothetical protein